jgi:MFS family permease
MCFADNLGKEWFISGFHTILPAIAVDLNIPQQSYTWPSSVVSLVTGAFLLPFGRLADMYGGYLVFNIGCIWFTAWSLVAGFSTDYYMLIVSRALLGLGSAAYLPAGIMLLGRVYRPGPRKNFIFSIYGAVCPVGFFIGIFMGGLSDEVLSWRWYFWLGSITCAIGCLFSVFSIPRDFAETRAMNVSMDWMGVATIIPGLLLVVYAITDSSQAPQGWATPSIYLTLALGATFLCAALYVEGWVASSPLIPGDMFRPKYMKRMTLCLFVVYGVFGLYLFYSNF